MDGRLVPIKVGGRYLWKDNSRFFVRGIVYQVHPGTDPISDDCLPQLEQDVRLFKELGLNTLYVYFVDNTKAHSRAMKMLADAGIYVLAGISTPSYSINRLNPYQSYITTTIISYFKTLDVMASFSNTLGIVAANTTVNNDATMSATPVIMAVIRDLKRYMKLKSETADQRILPICYSAAACGPRDLAILDFLSSSDASSSIDIWVCTNYSWIGQSDMIKSSYSELVVRLKDFTLPILFSEYSGRTDQPRIFEETEALYSPQMTTVFSGGCVYQLLQGSNGYGLVEILDLRRNPASAAYQEALARANDPRKVVEKRDIDQGLLLIYQDFVNYKEKLAAVRTEDLVQDEDVLQQRREKTSVRETHMSWPWEPEFRVPQSCVDWGVIEV